MDKQTLDAITLFASPGDAGHLLFLENVLCPMLAQKGETEAAEDIRRTFDIFVKLTNRLRLLREVFQAFCERDGAIEIQHVGGNLAFLLGTILSNEKLEICPGSEMDGVFFDILRVTIQPPHAVYAYLKLVE